MFTPAQLTTYTAHGAGGSPRRQLDRVAVGESTPRASGLAAEAADQVLVSASAVARRPVTTTLRAGPGDLDRGRLADAATPPPVTTRFLPARLMRGLVGRTYHDGPGELVVPPFRLRLSKAIHRKSEARRKELRQVREEASDEPAGVRLC